MFKLVMPSLPISTSSVLFDISRLFRSRKRTFATGVDRIDLAIGLDLARRFRNNCHFLYTGPLGTGLLPYKSGLILLMHLESVWTRQKSRKLPGKLEREPLLQKLRLRGRSNVITQDTTYVVASHSGIFKKKGAMAKLDPDKVMKSLVYLHDLIPVEMPEYQRPETRDAFEIFLTEATQRPLTIATNSIDTDRRVRAMALHRKWPVLGFLICMPSLQDLPGVVREPRQDVKEYLQGEIPFFTVVGTIEPRKNHLLLLNIWRDLTASGGIVPRLCIIGKRGWENENIIDMLERCDAIKGHVTEFDDLADHDVQTLTAASRALLFPSFAEGLGIPLLEAAVHGVRCVVSDLSVFREIAPNGTVFLDPIDGLGWKSTILSMVNNELDVDIAQ